MKRAIALNVPALLVALSVLQAGCGGPMGAADGDEAMNVEATSSRLTNGDVSADPAYVVEIRVDATSGGGFAGFCTGSVISSHYILTAAHCFGRSGNRNIDIRTGANAENSRYLGNANVEIHPNYVDGAVWTDNVPWDIAVVRLLGDGMDAPFRRFGAAFPRVRIYAGPETPWTARGGLFSVSGYGGGTGPGGAVDCPDQGPGDGAHTKRGGSFAFSGSGIHDGTTWFGVDGYASIRSLCHGDSGAGWRLPRNGEDFLFAIWSGGNFEHDKPMSATMVQPKMAWIEARTADTLGLPLVCTLVRDHRGEVEVDYYDCHEQAPRPPVASPATSPVASN